MFDAGSFVTGINVIKEVYAIEEVTVHPSATTLHMSYVDLSTWKHT